MTDYYIAKAGELHDTGSLTNVSVAPSGAAFTTINRSTRSSIQVWAAIYNTPASDWDTIKIRQMRNGVAGDQVKLRIYKGSIPDDAGTTADDSETPRFLDENDFVEEATYTRKSGTLASTVDDFDLVFKFNTTFNQSVLGASYTVVQFNLDVNGNAIASSECKFDSRSSLPHYTSPVDNGSDASQDASGAGNLYFNSSNISSIFNKYAGDPSLCHEVFKSSGREKYANVSLAPDEKTYEQARFVSDPWRWASTYNSPKDTFDTIIYRQLKSVSVGDIVTLKIYKGYIPDLGDTDQPTLVDRNLDSANLMASKSVTMTATAATDYVFQFDEEFSDVNLTSQIVGDAPQFTVFQETTDSGGTVISAHRTIFADRAVVPEIFTFPEDFGPDANSGDGGAGNTHGASNGTFFGNSGSALDRPLALEFLKSTDIPLGVSSGAGAIGSPVQTVAQVLALGPALGDTVFFRSGTYDTEIDNAGDSSYQFKLITDQAFSIKGYSGETVTFKPNNAVGFLFGYVSIRNNSGAEATLTIENINFITAADGSGCNSFMRLDSVANTAARINWGIKNCVFTQTGTQHSLINGAIYNVSSPAVGESITVEDSTFNVRERHVVQANPISGDVRFKNCNIIFDSPDNAVEADIDKPFFLNKPNNSSLTARFIMEDCSMVVTTPTLNAGHQLIQADYVNEVIFLNNNITINPNATSSTAAPYNELIRTYNKPSSIEGTSGRELDLFKFVGNTVIRNDTKGTVINLVGVAHENGTGGSLIIEDNQFICTNDLLRNQGNLGKVVTMLAPACDTIRIRNNKIRNFQDGFDLTKGGTVESVISGNEFENCGHDGASNYEDPLMIRLNDVGTGTSKTYITGNTFDLVEKQTCMKLSDGSDTTTKAVVNDNTFIMRGYRATAGTAGDFCLHLSSTGGTQHTFKGNTYLNMENLRTNRFVVYGGNVKTIAEGLAYDSEAHTSNAIKTLGAKSLVKPRLTKILGT